MSVDPSCFQESGEKLGLREFFKRYCDTFPQVLKVQEGYCSAIDIETLSQEQVLFVSTYVSQSRVLAVETGGKGQMLSLPQNYPVLLRVLGTSTRGRKKPLPFQSLESIVDQNKLPVEAEIMTPSMSQSVAGPDGSEVSLFPRLRLTDLFSEVFLVGYTIEARKDGCRLYTHPISVPSYLSHVTVTRVLGIVGMSQAKWHLALREMAAKVQDLHHNVDLTSPDFVIYSTNARFLEQSAGNPSSNEENVYDTLVPTAVLNCQTQKQTPSQPKDSPRKGKNPNVKQTPSSSDKEEAVSVLYEILRPPSPASTYEALDSYAPPPTGEGRASPIPDYFSSSSSGRPPGHVASIAMQPKGSGSTMEHKPPPPPVPSRPSVPPPPDVTSGLYSTMEHQLPPPLVPSRSSVPPPPDGTSGQRSTTEHKPPPPPVPSRPSVPPPPDVTSGLYSSLDYQELPPPPPPSRPSLAPPSSHVTSGPSESLMGDRRPVESLTISEVCEKLRLLNLERHQVAFQTQMVDGAVLSQMKMEDLKSDFKMTSAEAIRLMLYITKGHIPK